jgi:hypothetical protein
MALEIQEEGILITNKTLKGQLVEVCVKSYIQENLFEMIDTNRIRAELCERIGRNIVHENLEIEVSMINAADLYIKIYLDKISVDCNILHTGITTSGGFEHGDGPITRMTE